GGWGARASRARHTLRRQASRAGGAARAPHPTPADRTQRLSCGGSTQPQAPCDDATQNFARTATKRERRGLLHEVAERLLERAARVDGGLAIESDIGRSATRCAMSRPTTTAVRSSGSLSRWSMSAVMRAKLER